MLPPAEALRKFILDVGMPLNLAPEALGMAPQDFMNWWAGFNNKLIQNRELALLGQYLNIDESEITDLRYDRNFIRTKFFAGRNSLPEKYSQNQFSYMRSSAHIIKYLRLTRGQHFSDTILRKLSVYPLIYDDLNNKISLNFFMDLLDVLTEMGMSQPELDNLACMLFLSLENTPLGEKFRQARNHYECYEVVANNVHLFDNNFVYDFELDRKQLRIQAFLHFDSHTHINWSDASLDRLMRYRQILVGCYAYLSKLRPLFPECILERSKYGVNTTYIVNFNDSTNQLFSAPTSEANN